ncbi:MAG: hypothetical protein ACOH2L_14765 [Devosia sp.]
MNHEQFVKLANKTARNAQGMRPLACHVRRLYRTIRALQQDDNAFCYMAEVIQKARADKTDPLEFIDRVKTYYHRDRQAFGDALVKRGLHQRTNGSRASAITAETSEDAERNALNPSTKEAGVAVASDTALVVNTSREPNVSIIGEGPRAAGAFGHEEHDVRRDRGALTAALHHRPGRRRVISGG